ncbi:MAG: FAD-binding oxidoreductase [Thermoleophilaceae bacterium]
MRDPLAPRMRWWGWGEDDRAGGLPAHAEALLRDEFGAGGDRVPRVDLDDVRISASVYPGGLRERLLKIVGEGHVRDDRLSRVSHALGRSYIDLLRLRGGDGSSAPDAVVYPGSHDEVAAVLAACAEAGTAVTPFGGGTSVVGGVEPLRDGFSAAISLDLARMDRLLSADLRSLSATFAPGITGPRAEAALSARGLTLGHYPQSFEYATIGGFVATRSAGQASTGYGRIDELVLGLRCASPAGEIGARTVPASAAGPALRELLVGSEGVLGVVTEVTLGVRRAPEARRFEGWSFRSFEEGAEAFRAMEQAEASPDVARLSDEEETRISMALASSGSALERAGKAYLRVRGHEGGCIVIAGFEGDAREVERRRARTAAALRDAGAMALGERPGRSWERNRYGGPYLRDHLLDRGVLVETLETAATWSNLHDVYRGVGHALRSTLSARGTPPVVMCHVSHLYPAGASLYFTVLARQEEGAEVEQWRAAKTAASDAILAAGGTITHHHAVGADHAPWLGREVGELGLDVLRAAKERLDPAGIMNPGKLL